jgi:phosphatidate cytidylyltransferase
MQDNEAGTACENSHSPSREFGLRLISGVVLAAISLFSLWLGPKSFGALVLVAGLLMSWEWGRVVRGVEFDLAFVIHAASLVVAFALASLGYAALGAAVLLAGAITLIPLQFGERSLLSAAGVLYTGLPALSLLWFRGDEPLGFWAVVFLLTLVAVTDTAAYFVGRWIGGPKLWPWVSPNKTWSGLLGGIAGSAIAAAFFAQYLGASIPRLTIAGLLLGLIAQGGDLAESALKRRYGVKDASNLIPGHGGVLDRLDSIVAVALAATLFALVRNPSAPAAALLLGQ